MDSNIQGVVQKIINDQCKSLVYINGTLTLLQKIFSSSEIYQKEIDQLYTTVLQYHGYDLQYIAEEQRTFGLCKIAVQQDGFAIHIVSKKYLTSELCKIAVQQNGCAIAIIPEEYQTAEFYDIAFYQIDTNIGDIPKSKKL